MPTPSTSRAVSLSYGILAVMYLAILAVLANALWSGSLRRLWADLMYEPGSLYWPVGLFAIHATMSALCFDFRNRLFRGRIAIVCVAVLLSAAALYLALLGLIHWVRGQWEYVVSDLMIPAQFGIAVAYGWCAWSLWRIHATADNRLERQRRE